jgi:hypothetical protein
MLTTLPCPRGVTEWLSSRVAYTRLKEGVVTGPDHAHLERVEPPVEAITFQPCRSFSRVQKVSLKNMHQE